MPAKPTPPATTPKRTPDAFQSARTIYLARKRLYAKASQLFADAPLEVQSLVEAHEEADAKKSIDTAPSSPGNDDGPVSE